MEEEVELEEKETKKKKTFLREVTEWGIAFCVAVIFAVLIREFLFAPVLVDGESMRPTLNTQSRVIVNKMSYTFSKPERFDIVVYHATKESDYIKRVIALPGERIKYENDVLYINGEVVDEPYLDEFKRALPDDQPLTADFAEIVVPNGEYFLIGDNRRFSKDSRVMGTIPEHRIVGGTNLVFWPLNELRFVE